ncbi:pyridoxal phosphate-dependent aminotransferase [Capilliphycus salinus ALCB114379]|uniref:pyridoxal phosphate-dependent aminotransferase n=1 Tax=Capilliphycus salinus TaxID=2768948 RepID=UPI0039A776E5
MNHQFSRMQFVQSPIIPVVGELINAHPGTISLGQGVVYYNPPTEAFEAISNFANSDNHKYKAVVGIQPLQEVIAAKLQAENRILITDKNCIVVTAGSNMGFMNAVLAMTSPGDEIILQTPYYFNHEMAIMMANCQPILVETDEHYQLRPEAIKQAITEKTRAVVTISPNNPTGAVYSEKALREVNEICRQHEIYQINDEAYEYFTYNNIKHFSPGSINNSENHTISLFSLSKAYGFASWRIGYMVIPEHLRFPIQKVQDTILICPPVISQYAAIGALKAGLNYCKPKIKEIAEVREIMLEELSQLDSFCTVPSADGAFYVLLKIDTNLPAMTLVEKLIQEFKVAVIPGTTFGITEGCYLRVAYGALQKETATEGIQRLVKGLKQLV